MTVLYGDARKGNMQIEAVSSENQIAIVENLACEIWNEYFTAIIGQAQVGYMLKKFQSTDVIAEQIKSGFLYYLIKNNNEYTGYLSVCLEDKKLFLSKLYILSTERGKGYGRKAIIFIEKLAAEKGLSEISLTVNKNNSSTIKVYENLGFENKGSLVKDIGQGFIMDDYKMEKSIQLTE